MAQYTEGVKQNPIIIKAMKVVLMGFSKRGNLIHAKALFCLGYYTMVNTGLIEFMKVKT